MSSNQYFRAGIGVVLYTDNKQIYLFKRSQLPIIWQFPQGGMDEGESIEETLWRELYEETGLTKSKISKVTPYPHWLLYEYHTDARQKLPDPNCIGQIHRWFFLNVKSDTTIDLSTATDDEFTDTTITSFEELLKQKNQLKQKVYQTLANYFETEIYKT